MRAPPEAVKMSSGNPSAVARSIVRVIFSPTTEPIEPIMKVVSMMQSATSMFAIFALPQRTASSRSLFLRIPLKRLS